MKLKYYLRGLGVGILVSTILLTVSFYRNRTMSDAEVIERAEALGMVKAYESGVLEEKKDSGQETEEKPDEAGENTGQDESGKKPDDGEENGTGKETEAESTVSDNQAGSGELQDEEETIVITIDGGEGSGTVARKLKSAGLIEDAAEYDRYLCQNGYDKRLRVGKHTIPVGADNAEIAKLITSKE